MGAERGMRGVVRVQFRFGWSSLVILVWGVGCLVVWRWVTVILVSGSHLVRNQCSGTPVTEPGFGTRSSSGRGPASVLLILSDTVSGSSDPKRAVRPSSRRNPLACTDRANRTFQFRCRSTPETTRPSSQAQPIAPFGLTWSAPQAAALTGLLPIAAAM